jgi:signal transduction histidine kinase
MLTVEEQLIDRITETMHLLLNGEEPPFIFLPKEFPENEIRQLVDYVNSLIKNQKNLSEYILSLSGGNLNTELTRGRSKILFALKDLHSHLLHLTWQTQQIANGDYNQKVDFMGDFSIAFNKMTAQLKESFDEIKRKNSELTESERKLKEAIATKDKFFSIIAHDLRSPISSFMGMMQILTDEKYKVSDKQKNDSLKLLKTSAEQTFNLLENLLSWSRSQQGLIKNEPTKNDIVELINENISLLSTNAKNKLINLINESKGSISGYFDHSMINTVVRNLISNALKFTNENGFVKLLAEERDDCIQVSVTDSGVGINPVNLQKIFKIAETVTTNGTKGEKGTGLGLILCKEFVEKNNGKIWVESELAKGTTFVFTLPKASDKND